MPGERVRVVVLGAGSWTCVNHLPEIERRADVELVAAVDTSPDRRRRVQERFPFELVTDSVDRALAEEPDALSVGSTPDAHHQLVKAALDSGANVLSEKPFCTSAEQAWELVELARSRDLELLTAFGWNYQQIVQDARELLDRHGIGDCEHMQIHMATALREMYQEVMPVWGRPDEFLPVEGSYTRLAKGAGYAQAQLSHALGLALWLVPLRGERVFSFMNNPAAEVDLYDAVSLRMQGGCTVSLSGACHPLGANRNKHQMEARFFGSDGQLLLDLDRELVWFYRDESTNVRLDVAEDAGAYTGAGPATALVDLTLGLPDAENRSPGELAARVTEIVQAAYASWRSGLPEDVPLPAGANLTGA
jgi:predicted dehydrogenase